MTGLAAPTPRTFYVHDDLTGDVRERHGAGSPAARLAQELLELVRRDRRVVVLGLEEQIERVVARGPHAPFGMTLGIGRAGERVARQLHARTGWFPCDRRVEVTREEDGDGYTLVSLSGEPLARQLAGLEAYPSLAVVDDTVWSGLTMCGVLDALPAGMLARTRAFCLRGVAEALSRVASLCPITPGFVAQGKILEDVSLINASGLVRRGAIRRAGQPPLAFFDRPEWIQAWFPGHAADVMNLCRRLHALLED